MAPNPLSASELFTVVASLFIVWAVGGAIYNLFFHPLRSYPGPLFYRMTHIPWAYKRARGTLAFEILELHERYGSIVRIAPDELAFSDPSAWKDIFGHRKGRVEEMSKFEGFYRPIKNLIAPDILNSSSREEHSMLRRQLAHGFSERSMRDQEPLIKKYVDLLITRFRERCGKGPINVTSWYNFATFDIIGDLAYGQPFGCLEKSDYHPWVSTLFNTALFGSLVQTAYRFPKLNRLLWGMIPVFFIPNSLMKYAKEYLEHSKEELARRIENGEERPDLIEGLLRNREELGLTMDHLQANSRILVIAGSETTATLLSGLTFLLLTNPEAFSKLTKEVRSTFSKEDDINIVSVGKLHYMMACIDEALRMYPPVPIGLPRVVPPGGAVISGKFVPENTVVAIHHWAMYHSSTNFIDPFTFHPERFLGDPAFVNDSREAFQPFSLGPRNCIGRNLAYTEIRLILARVIFNFDMRLTDESRGWMDQKVFNIWRRGQLKIHFIEAGDNSS